MLTSIISKPNEFAKYSLLLVATLFAPKLLLWFGIYKSLITIGLVIFAITITIWAISQVQFSLKFYFLILIWLSVAVATFKMVNFVNLQVGYNIAAIFAFLAFIGVWLIERRKDPEIQMSPLKIWAWLGVFSLNYGLWIM